MATKPTPGGSDGTYGTELNAFLDVSLAADGKVKTEALQTDSTAPSADAALVNRKFVTDGASKVTDGSVVTGYRFCSVNDGAVQQVFTKYFTGNLDGDSSTSVAHGVTVAKILAVSVICLNFGNSVYWVSEAHGPESATVAFHVFYDATNIKIENVGSALQGNAYRIRMDYTI